ncbi:hypothetical protein ACFY04_08245 [Streptomyces sp. NPDC001549]|uniref:hypothetical protein n=1 Tax=Streptomyces sp. NPDC001549 TaxID=3364586 RepID=UPI00367BB34E
MVEHLKRPYSYCRFFLLSADHESSPEGKRKQRGELRRRDPRPGTGPVGGVW